MATLDTRPAWIQFTDAPSVQTVWVAAIFPREDGLLATELPLTVLAPLTELDATVVLRSGQRMGDSDLQLLDHNGLTFIVPRQAVADTEWAGARLELRAR